MLIELVNLAQISPGFFRSLMYLLLDFKKRPPIKETPMFSNNSNSQHTLSVVIPLYNEEENLPLLVSSLFEVLFADQSFLELILVDDGSQDRTAAMAAELAELEPRIRLLRHERNRGLGATIRTGLEAAVGDLILYTDADLPFDFRLIPQLLEHANDDRLIIGCRLNRGEGPRRWVLTNGYNLLCRMLLGLRVRDINFACKLIPRSAVNGMRLSSEGSFIDAEILLGCRQQGLEIVEFPLTYFPRTHGQSTLSRPQIIIGILLEMYRYLNRTAQSDDQRMLPAQNLLRYGMGKLSVLAALMLSLALHLFITFSPLAFFLPAVLLTAWKFGHGPGLLATVLSIFAIDCFLRPPVLHLTIGWSDLSRLVILVLMTLAAAEIGWRIRMAGRAV